MSILLRIFVCFSGIIQVYIALKAIVYRRMTEKLGLYWIFGGIIIFIFGLFPWLVFFVADKFSVDYPPSIIFAIAIIILFYGLFKSYQVNAELTAKVQEMAMQISLLNQEYSQMKEEGLGDYNSKEGRVGGKGA